MNFILKEHLVSRKSKIRFFSQVFALLGLKKLPHKLRNFAAHSNCWSIQHFGQFARCQFGTQTNVANIFKFLIFFYRHATFAYAYLHN